MSKKGGAVNFGEDGGQAIDMNGKLSCDEVEMNGIVPPSDECSCEECGSRVFQKM